MKKILLPYISFVVACLAVIVAFITATTLIQLAVAIILYPVLIFFAFKVFPRKAKHFAAESFQEEVAPEAKEEVEEESTAKKSFGISDTDKRVFLKLIGSAGIFLFLFSLFNKRTESLFFQKLPGNVSGNVSLENIAGEKIDPAQNQPLDGYRITEIDNDDISFYGYTNKEGAWFVMRVDSDSGSFRYYRGETGFPQNWKNRKKFEYDYYNNVF